MAAMLGTSAMAQFQVAPKVDNMDAPLLAPKADYYMHWEPIGTPFVANDLRDNTEISLQSYLDDGKFVVIDYSAAWCNPCWQLHRSGLLEQLNALEDFQVIWVESELTNTPAQVTGTSTNNSYSGYTCGNWVDPHGTGEAVPFPMIDDDANGTCNATCASLNDNYVPLLILIAPNGQACNLRGAFSASAVAQSIQFIQAIAASYPQAGQEPQVYAYGAERVMTGANATFTAYYNSIDPVTSISWSATGATPSSGTGESFTCSFANPGTYEVTLSITNANGTATYTHNIEAYTIPAGALSYTYDEVTEDESGIGTGNVRSVYWAVSFPPSALANMPDVASVDCWVASSQAGSYTMKVYSGTATAPTTELGSVTRNVTAGEADQYVNFDLTTPAAVDQTKTLWIVMTTSNTYPAMGVDYVGDPNSDWISTNGSSWTHANNDNDLPYSWLITAYSSDLGIEDASAAKVEVAPNPTADRVTVKAEGLRYIEVIDVAGRVVMTNRTSNVVDMSALNAGVYMFNVVTETGSAMTKVVKQ